MLTTYNGVLLWSTFVSFPSSLAVPLVSSNFLHIQVSGLTSTHFQERLYLHMASWKHGIKQSQSQKIIHIQAENLLTVCGSPFHSILFSSMKPEFCDMSGFRHGVNEIFAPQGFYTA
jgi:hypothetical protein